MSFSNLTRRTTYAGDNAQVNFSVPFPFLDADDLVVTKVLTSGVRSLLEIGGGYTVTGDGQPSGGNVILPSALLTGQTLIIERTVSLTQPVDIANLSEGYQEVIEGGLDRLAQIGQQLAAYATTLDEVAVAEPTASLTYRNKMIAVRPSGGPNSVKICLEQADGVFAWKTVTLT